jgi:hypothetical protein
MGGSRELTGHSRELAGQVKMGGSRELAGQAKQDGSSGTGLTDAFALKHNNIKVIA